VGGGPTGAGAASDSRSPLSLRLQPTKMLDDAILMQSGDEQPQPGVHEAARCVTIRQPNPRLARQPEHCNNKSGRQLPPQLQQPWHARRRAEEEAKRQSAAALVRTRAAELTCPASPPPAGAADAAPAMSDPVPAVTAAAPPRASAEHVDLVEALSASGARCCVVRFFVNGKPYLCRGQLKSTFTAAAPRRLRNVLDTLRATAGEDEGSSVRARRLL